MEQKTEKVRYDAKLARGLGEELCAVLEPVTERIMIAGSLRRGKATVGDIEILYIPKIERRIVPAVDLFAPVTVDLTEAVLGELIARGVIERRKNVKGSYMWGFQNKLGRLVESGIPVDFFATGRAAWWNYLVCRTGGAECNVRIAEAAQRKGWKWNPYGVGFTDEEGNQVAVESEEDVFRLAGLPYLPPEGR